MINIPSRRLFGRPSVKVLKPWLFRLVLKSLYRQFTDRAHLDSALRHLIPKGNPGAGMVRGQENIAKTMTYRATYVPGGFNKERDARRATRHAVVTDGVF